MTASDLLCSTLISLVEVTRQMCAAVEGEEFGALSDLLDKREQLLEQQSFLLVRWKDSPQNADNRDRDRARLKPLMEALQQYDQHLGFLITRRKDEVAEQLQQAQNQKRLLAYVR